MVQILELLCYYAAKIENIFSNDAMHVEIYILEQSSGKIQQ